MTLPEHRLRYCETCRLRHAWPEKMVSKLEPGTVRCDFCGRWDPCHFGPLSEAELTPPDEDS